MIVNKRLCPICSSDNPDFLASMKFVLPREHCLPDRYAVVHCQKCGFVYADVAAAQEIYDQYYTQQSKYEDTQTGTGNGDDSYDADRLKTMATKLSRYFSPDASILDIGCAGGGLLKELKAKGFTDLSGLDPSEKCVEQVNSNGITAYLGSVFDCQSIGGLRFDAIILSGVLEHLYDVAGAVQIVRELLNENGMVFIDVPDAEQYCKHNVVPYYYFDVEHINHFGMNDLTNLLGRFNFKYVARWQNFYPMSSNFLYPTLSVVFQKSDQKREFTYSDDVLQEMTSYMKMSNQDVRYQASISALVASQEPVVVWGAGMHTFRLLHFTELGKCNIVAFIDNDRKKQGKVLYDRNIFSQEFLHEYNGTLLLCSAYSNDVIRRQLFKAGCPNKILTLD